MPMLIATPLYTALLTSLAMVLAVRVIQQRRIASVSLGTRGDERLERAVRAHGNLIEYAPLALLMLAFLELNGASPWLVHASGILLMLGRSIHAWSIPNASSTGRVAGMATTFTSWGVLILANVVVSTASAVSPSP